MYAIRSYYGVDMVYHLAGVTKARTREGYFRGNRDVTRNILGAVLESNPGVRRFVHVSSGAAVGPASPGKPVDETRITSYNVCYTKLLRLWMQLF